MIIHNESDEDLTLADLPTPIWGYWETPPPSTLKAKSNSHLCKLFDSSGPAGSEGSFTYKTAAGSTFTASFACPYHGSNNGSLTGEYEGRQEFDISWTGWTPDHGTKQDGIPVDGHPCNYDFYIKDKSK
tara:strand:+ start:3445 stop:3831 length:387 start_codon:yes stop_codon:yes gene_type:complete